MARENSCAAPMIGAIGNGAVGRKAVQAPTYLTPSETSTAADYAAAKLTTKFRLCIETAHLFCRLSGLGGLANG